MTEELQPCPFCGSGLVDPFFREEHGSEEWYVFCDRCHTEGPIEYSKVAAIEKWNERTQSTNGITSDIIICPGCGWMGVVEDLPENGCCPECDYENNQPPYRLLTLEEMLEDEWGEYDNVRMDSFLTALFRVLSR